MGLLARLKHWGAVWHQKRRQLRGWRPQGAPCQAVTVGTVEALGEGGIPGGWRTENQEHIYHTTVIPRVLVYEVRQDLYHRQ